MVANEVKKLAKETAKASESISQTAETIQSGTQTACQSMEQAHQVIAKINELQRSIACTVEEQNSTSQRVASNILTFPEVVATSHRTYSKLPRASKRAPPMLRTPDEWQPT